MRYIRKPYRYIVTVDGREVGEPFRSKQQAMIEAEHLQTVAPWAFIEVQGVLK